MDDKEIKVFYKVLDVLTRKAPAFNLSIII